MTFIYSSLTKVGIIIPKNKSLTLIVLSLKPDEN